MTHFTGNSLLQIGLYFLVLLLSVKPLGSYMARVYMHKPVILDKVLGPLEKLLYAIAGTRADEEMTWQKYSLAMIVYSFASFALLYFILLFQSALPFNPQGFADLSPDLAFNTAVSFVTNTNWQSYGGESTMSYFSQFAGLAVQNFVSAAVGMAVMVALIRGIARKTSSTIGNFWVDVTRTNLYILLPLALLWTMLLVWQGVPQTFDSYPNAQMVEAQDVAEVKDATGSVTQKADHVTQQSIALGPVASQVAIKQLGTNGGGFYNANSAHPFENPTPLSNFLEMIAILLIPAALCYTFGVMVGDRRQGWAILVAMTVIFTPFVFLCHYYEQEGNPLFAAHAIDQGASDAQPGGNMEGKEARFGIVDSAIWATATTAASNGSVNSMHDSYTPLGGMMPLILLQFSEVIYGGVGSGLYGMLMYVLVTVFIAGLMVGRTPEYLGKKVQAFEMKMASIAILASPLVVLLGAAIACVSDAGIAGMMNPGAHGFTEILYAFTSAGDNNGSAFAGLNANTPFYNTALGLVILFGRYWVIIPVLAIAGSLAQKKAVPTSAGTLPTHTPLFIGFLVGTVVLVGVLTYVPALALGPVAEYVSLPGVQP